MSYKPTVYEQIARDILDGKNISYKNYAEELTARGWNERHFKAYMKDLLFIRGIMDEPNLSLREKQAKVNADHPSKEEDVLSFSLTEKEKQIVLKAEDKGRIKAGDEITYDGYSRKIIGADFLNLPKETDAFVTFSGHPGAAGPAVVSWLNDYRKTGKPKKLIFIGLYDNQGNTKFNESGYEYNVGSEAEMYRRYFKAIGISEEIINQCIVTPTDISTEDNIAVLAKIRDKYFKKKEVSFAMFAYPSYQKRIASEFAFGFEKLEKEGKIKGTNFIMPDVPVLPRKKRYFSYDRLDGIAQDIIIGNCMAHPYRVYAGGRFDSKLGQYPEEYKALLPISLVYSYPNVANELADTRIDVATMLKLHRGLQHHIYGWEAPDRVDRTIRYNVARIKKQLLEDGLISEELMAKGAKLSRKDFLKSLKKFYKQFIKAKEIAKNKDKLLQDKRQCKELLRNMEIFDKKR